MTIGEPIVGRLARPASERQVAGRRAATPPFITTGTSIALLAVTVAGVARTVSAPTFQPSGIRLLFFPSLAALHALLGTVGLRQLERRETRVLFLHFAIATAVAQAALVLSGWLRVSAHVPALAAEFGPIAELSV
jgi:hypothetical protein